MMTLRARATAMLAFATLLALPAAPASAQEAAAVLDAGHWTWDAIRRLNVLGVAPAASDPAMAPVTFEHALRVFTSAAETARAQGDTVAAEAAEGYRRLLLAGVDSGAVLSVLRAGPVAVSQAGGRLAGGGVFLQFEGPDTLRATHEAGAAFEGHGLLRPWLGWAATGAVTTEGVRVAAAALSVPLGPFDVWAGRRPIHHGMGRGGGVVAGTGWRGDPYSAAGSHAVIDGLGIHVRDPFFFPGFLRFLGPDRIEIAAGRLEQVGDVEQPYVVFGRLIGSPFSDRFVLGLNRGAIFGGKGRPLTARNIWGLLVGQYQGTQSEFENQVISGMIRYRPPVGPLPLEFYLEWGADDMAGAIWDAPGVVAGIDIGSVMNLPGVSAGIEQAYFEPGGCCTNPLWYRSPSLGGGWADEGRLLAHPLGGHGREWLLHARWDSPANGVLLRGQAYLRRRGAENLFAPDWQGRSAGGSLAAELIGARRRVQVHAEFEQGDGWQRHRLATSLHFDLGPH